MRYFLIASAMVIMLLSLGGCDENTEEEYIGTVESTEPAREGVGTVTCYNPDGSVFFDEVGSYVHTYKDGTQFSYLKNHPKYIDGSLRFSTAWRCLVNYW